MLEVVDDLAVAGDESAQRAETLGESAHNEVGLVRQAEVAGGAAAVLSYDAESVGIIHHHAGVVLLAELHDAGQGSDVAFHRVHSVHHYQLGSIDGDQFELGLESFHIVVGELADLGESESAAVYDAGVVKGVEEGVSSSESEAAHHSQIHLESGAVCDCLLLAHKLRKLLFQLLVYVQSTVQKAASGAAGAVFAHCRYGSFL